MKKTKNIDDYYVDKATKDRINAEISMVDYLEFRGIYPIDTRNRSRIYYKPIFDQSSNSTTKAMVNINPGKPYHNTYIEWGDGKSTRKILAMEYDLIQAGIVPQKTVTESCIELGEKFGIEVRSISGKILTSNNLSSTTMSNIEKFNQLVKETKEQKLKEIEEFKKTEQYKEKLGGSGGKYTIISVEDKIKQKALIDYLKNKALEPEIAFPFIKQIKYNYTNKITNKNYDNYAIGFPNLLGGYETRIPNTSIKVCMGKKSISLIKGRANNQNLAVFESFTSYLAGLEMSDQLHPTGDVAILNSTELAKLLTDAINSTKEKNYINEIHSEERKETLNIVLQKAQELNIDLSKYKRINLFLDNDQLKGGHAGERAALIIKESLKDKTIEVNDCSFLYNNFNDIGDKLKHDKKTGLFKKLQKNKITNEKSKYNKLKQYKIKQ